MAVEIVRIIFNFVEYFDDQRLERVDWIDVSIDNKVEDYKDAVQKARDKMFGTNLTKEVKCDSKDCDYDFHIYTFDNIKLLKYEILASETENFIPHYDEVDYYNEEENLRNELDDDEDD